MATAPSNLNVQGKIELCPHQGCEFRCCDFSAGNYIALYPGELESAEEKGRSLEHLKITPDGAGGHRATCLASDCTTCDGGYKPLDCASYPYFPTVDAEGSISADLKGAKCPLKVAQTGDHREWVARKWLAITRKRPEVKAWLARVRLLGYTLLRD